MIRWLKPGEVVPTWEPRRYPNSQGYVRLRWKLGKGEYCEVLEHRVFDGRVTEAPQVHHRNRNRADNSPENLMPTTSAEHGTEHRVIDRIEARRRYEGGQSLPTIAREMGCDSGALSRLLRAEGVKMRGKVDYAPHVPEEALRAARVDPEVLSAHDLAARFGVPLPSIYRLMRTYGIPSFPTGCPVGFQQRRAG